MLSNSASAIKLGMKLVFFCLFVNVCVLLFLSIYVSFVIPVV